jgi:oligoendopeptidase F
LYVLSHELGHALHSFESRDAKNQSRLIREIPSLLSEIWLSESLIQDEFNLKDNSRLRDLQMAILYLLKAPAMDQFERRVFEKIPAGKIGSEEDLHREYEACLQERLGSEYAQYDRKGWIKMPQFFSQARRFSNLNYTMSYLLAHALNEILDPFKYRALLLKADEMPFEAWIKESFNASPREPKFWIDCCKKVLRTYSL